MKTCSISLENLFSWTPRTSYSPPGLFKDDQEKFDNIKNAFSKELAEGPFWLLNSDVSWFGPDYFCIKNGELHKRFCRISPAYQKWLLKSLYHQFKREKPDRFEFEVLWGKNTSRKIIVTVEDDRTLCLDLDPAPAALNE